jgi:hypothetical protein
MEAGEIGFGHLAVIARTAQAVGKVVDEYGLLELARKLSPGKLFFECLHYRHSVDATAYCKEQSEQEVNHHLELSMAESGHLLINELASGGKPANIQVTATIETLKGLAGAAGAEMEFSLPISSTSLQRMACDCSVTRVLLNQDSLTIDVGRSRRVISGAMRKALKVRDGHCRWPGCERPASWCDGHHLLHWIHGGTTDLDNLVLLCRRHHRMVHEESWQLVKTDDGQIMPIAPTLTFGRPRAPD